MKKKVLAAMLAFALAASYTAPVLATTAEEDAAEEAAEEEADEEETEDETDEADETEDGEAALEDAQAADEDGAEDAAEAEETEEDTEEDAADELVFSTENLVEVDTIDLSLHSETSGEFTAVYAYENPFKGTDTSAGVILEFYALPTWEVHELGAIFAFVGTGDYDGRLYFSPGSYLGYNSGGFGGYYDANLYNYILVTDYIKDGAKIRIELTPDGFAVYADDELCYDQTILDDPEQGSGDFNSSSDFSSVLEWLAGADALYFGYGSWWNTVGSNEANIDLSELSFRLWDGTVVMDQLLADKELVESLGGSVEASSEEDEKEVELEEAEVEIFDINSVEYEGYSMLPVMAVIVLIVVIAAAAVVVTACRPHKYDDVA